MAGTTFAGRVLRAPFPVGSYQVREKWLKGCRGRVLTYDGLTYYAKVVRALGETICLMAQIDAPIPKWPIHSTKDQRKEVK